MVETEGGRPHSIGDGQGRALGRRNESMVEVGGGNEKWTQQAPTHTHTQRCTGPLPLAHTQVNGCGGGRGHTHRTATQRADVDSHGARGAKTSQGQRCGTRTELGHSGRACMRGGGQRRGNDRNIAPIVGQALARMLDTAGCSFGMPSMSFGQANL